MKLKGQIFEFRFWFSMESSVTVNLVYRMLRQIFIWLFQIRLFMGFAYCHPPVALNIIIKTLNF